MIAIASVVPLVFTGVAATRIADRHHVAQTRALYGKQAGGLALLTLTWLEERLRGLQLALEVFDVDSLNEEEREGLLRFVYRQFDAVNVAVLRDSGGITVAGPQRAKNRAQLLGTAHQVVGPERLDQFQDRMPQKEAMATGLARGPAYLPPDGSEPVIPIAIRTSGERPHVLGVELSLVELVNHFLAQGGEGAAVVLVGQDGVVLAGEPGQLIRTEIVQGFGSGLEGELSYALEDGTQVLAAFASVGGTPWNVVVATPESTVTQAGREIGDRTWFMVGLAILTAIAMGLLGARQVALPVVALKDAALKVAEGDLGRRVPAVGSRELVELTRAFNFMSSRLARDQEEIAAKNAEIQAFNEELQERVEERTRELEEAQVRLLESSRMAAVAQMGAGLAHELNNPVAGILGLAQVGQARSPEGPEIKTLLRIEELGQRCREILTALGRFTGSGRPVERKTVSLHALAVDVEGLVHDAFLDARVSLKILDGEDVEVSADEALLAEALAQLLRSIRVEVAAEGVVEAEVGRTEDWATLSLTIRGERKERGDDWLASGMGYWVARRVLGEHGGLLEELQEPGAPAYRVLLPLV
jgi:signal transduction histidine kinase